MLSQSSINDVVDTIRLAQGRQVKRLGTPRKPRHKRVRTGPKPHVYAHPSKLAQGFREAHEYA